MFRHAEIHKIHSKTQKLCNSEIHKFRYLEIQKFRNSEFQKFRILYLKSSCSNIQKFGNLQFKNSEILQFRNSEIRKFRKDLGKFVNSEIRKLRITAWKLTNSKMRKAAKTCNSRNGSANSCKQCKFDFCIACAGSTHCSEKMRGIMHGNISISGKRVAICEDLQVHPNRSCGRNPKQDL